MDYKKTYEGALERAKQYLENAREAKDFSAVARYENIFPELAEPEDERIRKEIVTWMKDSTTYDWQENKERWLAYLEKLKEQKPEEKLGKYSEEENLAYRLNWVMQDYYKAGKDDEEKEHRFKCYQLFWNALEDANFFEQKELKPAEWSEEDEKMLKLCESRILGTGTFVPTTTGLYDMVSWLKSLRPQNHWKPSDEQMVALKDVVETYRVRHNASIDGDSTFTRIESLYSDLQKLL